MTVDRLALRIDDIGASSKRYEVYSDKNWCIGPLKVSGNWLFLKYLPAIKKWGPYREMMDTEWFQVFDVLAQADAKLTVGITASWVESEHSNPSFPERFPAEAQALRQGLQQGLIEIANHGLTHCVTAGNAFKPKLMDGNRAQHREFWDWLPDDLHEEHIARSQEILQGYFKTDVVTFVPPGNVFSAATLRSAKKHGIRYVSSNTVNDLGQDIRMIDPEMVLAYHDRELVLEGVSWLKALLADHREQEKVFLRELGELQ